MNTAIPAKSERLGLGIPLVHRFRCQKNRTYVVQMIPERDISTSIPRLFSRGMESAFLDGCRSLAAVTHTLDNKDGSRTVASGEVSRSACPRCQSANTLRIDGTLEREYWHCYECRRTFDVALEREEPQRRATDRKRQITR